MLSPVDSLSFAARFTPKTPAEWVALTALAIGALGALFGAAQLAVALLQLMGARKKDGKKTTKPRGASRVRSALRRSSDMRVGTALSGLAVVALMTYPAALVLGAFQSAWWLVGWLALFTVKAVYDNWLRGAYVERARNRLQDVNMRLGSFLDTLGAKLRQSHDQRLSEAESRALAVILLQRVYEYVIIALDLTEVRIRTTLTVPNSGETALRVWCYNDTHPDRRWTELPLLTGSSATPGSPAAYLSGNSQIISDIHTLEIPGSKDRSFRSVVSIPLKAGGAGGKCLGVLNIDAEVPNLFMQEDVEQKIVPLLSVPLSLLALVLLMRRDNATYAFGH